MAACYPVNIFGFYKRLIGNVLQRLKNDGTKTIYIRMFLKHFMYAIYKTFNEKY